MTADEFEAARAEQLVEEKALTRQLDALAARRRRLPATPVTKRYTLTGAEGEVELLDLFDGRRPLIIYHFMFPAGKQDPCLGCTTFTDNITGLVHVRARDANFVLVSRAPVEELHAYRDRMGWDIPWYSSAGATYNEDFGATSASGGEVFRLTVLLRDGDDIYKTYWTDARGTDRLHVP